jgi:hypothetical protein
MRIDVGDNMLYIIVVIVLAIAYVFVECGVPW